MKGSINYPCPQLTHPNPLDAPGKLKLLAAGFLLVSAFGWLRMQQALAHLELAAAGASLAFARLLTFSGAVWGVAGWAASWGFGCVSRPPHLSPARQPVRWPSGIGVSVFAGPAQPQGWVNWPFPYGNHPVPGYCVCRSGAAAPEALFRPAVRQLPAG